MTPKQRKIGEKIEILCPTCDGEGIVIAESVDVDCPDCEGKGKLEGIVSKQ